MEILMLKDTPILIVEEDAAVEILDFERLPFALRTKEVSAELYLRWLTSRTLQIDRQNAKELLNRYRLPQYDRYRICKACRGFSLNDSYWIKEENDTATWESRNLFGNELSVSVIETSLSGRLHRISHRLSGTDYIREVTPELTTWGVNAKAWIKEDGILYMHKIGKNEVGASQILDAIGVEHIEYRLSTQEQVDRYVTEEIQGWLSGVGEAIVHSALFTSEDVAFVSFDEFGQFCDLYGAEPLEEAIRIDPHRYCEMQIIDHVLNNSDRHGQNWGFYMNNQTGKVKGMALHFDHDKAFNRNLQIPSLTSVDPMLQSEAAKAAVSEVELDLKPILGMDKPVTMTDDQWRGVLMRTKELMA